MENFDFYAPTKILFGKDRISELPDILCEYGNRVLLVYGKGSIKRSGIYSDACKVLKRFDIFELPDVDPNPKIESVQRGIEICRKNNIQVVLGIGGGSVIDCAKVIAAGFFYNGDPWDIVVDSSKITNALPIITVLTLAATGSEMNQNAVITRMQTNEKIGTHSSFIIPKVSILDPQYLYTLPPIQTAAGTADIMSHVMEVYFNTTKGTEVSDRICEGILKTCINCCRKAMHEPMDYNTRANLMWAGTVALNGICGAGKVGEWTCHTIEHQMGAYYDITHGVGLAIITPRWMRYILNNKTVEKFMDFAVNVWDVPRSKDKFDLATNGIYCLEQFFIECGIPMTLPEVGIDESGIEVMAEAATKNNRLSNAYFPLKKQDVESIFRMCL